jgi:diguanylate cyclase (GGDEF)-like protein
MGLLAPLAVAIRAFALPQVAASLGGTDSALYMALLGTTSALAGAGVACLLAALAFGSWLHRVSGAVDRIADGDFGVRLGTPRGGGVQARVAIGIDRIAAQLAVSHDAATIDRLTGVANRQSLLASLFEEAERATRYERPLSVAFVDIDHFKAVNDTYGHQAGDLVLQRVAGILASNIRASDRVGRYGGEEFMLLLAETGAEEATALAEKLRLLVMREHFELAPGSTANVTISIGIAGGVGRRIRFEALVRDADAAMYSAKSLGRNQTYVFAEPDDESRVPRAPISAEGRESAARIGQAARAAAEDLLQSVVSPMPHYRGRPSALIAVIATARGRSLGLPDADVDRIRVASLLHDVGKIAIPAEILEKPAPLSTAEWQSVVQHPRIGQLILEQASALRDAVPIILHHHERFSGRGYPYGLHGQDIPLGARIVSIADAYDAMMHDRPYRAAIGHAQAIEELRLHAGTQFDPELVALFTELFNAGIPGWDYVGRTLRPAGSASASRRPIRSRARRPESSSPRAAAG